mmetsp:Transcript_17354/g.50656  ORF Transcript_17354/g.50656 Transcript_17354/m.50656 type:complete len:242 (-) Transcript_17354:374-1099(-)
MAGWGRGLHGCAGGGRCSSPVESLLSLAPGSASRGSGGSGQWGASPSGPGHCCSGSCACRIAPVGAPGAVDRWGGGLGAAVDPLGGLSACCPPCGARNPRGRATSGPTGAASSRVPHRCSPRSLRSSRDPPCVPAACSASTAGALLAGPDLVYSAASSIRPDRCGAQINLLLPHVSQPKAQTAHCHDSKGRLHGIHAPGLSDEWRPELAEGAPFPSGPRPTLVLQAVCVRGHGHPHRPDLD